MVFLVGSRGNKWMTPWTPWFGNRIWFGCSVWFGKNWGYGSETKRNIPLKLWGMVRFPYPFGGGPPLIVIAFWVGKTFENVSYIFFVRNPYNQHLQKCNLHLARYLQNLEGPEKCNITFLRQHLPKCNLHF